MNKPRSNEELFVVDNTISRNIVRKRVLKESLIPYECAICNQLPFWNGKPMSLILDHINGVGYDHRLENLRFVCGNCNLQLDTYGSKNSKRGKKKVHCADCNSLISNDAVRCKSCAAKIRHQSRRETCTLANTSSRKSAMLQVTQPFTER